MAKISPIHWRKFGKFLKFVGCEHKRTKGSHMIFQRKDLKRPIVIPKDKELPVFIIRNNLRVLGMGHDEYLEILERM